MISYKRDVLSRQSLRSKDEQRLSNLWKCVKRLWNTFKTTFLNIKLQRLCKSHHLQCIASSKVSEKLEKSVRKGQGWRPLLDARGFRALRRHCITHRQDSVIDITKWAQEYFQKPLSVNNPPCHLQMPTKSLSCKKRAICEHGPEAPLCPVGQGSFKMDRFKVEVCSMVRRVQI